MRHLPSQWKVAEVITIPKPENPLNVKILISDIAVPSNIKAVRNVVGGKIAADDSRKTTHTDTEIWAQRYLVYSCTLLRHLIRPHIVDSSINWDEIFQKNIVSY